MEHPFGTGRSQGEVGMDCSCVELNCRVYFEKDKVADTQGPRFLEFEKCDDGGLKAVAWMLLDMLAARGSA